MSEINQLLALANEAAEYGPNMLEKTKWKPQHD